MSTFQFIQREPCQQSKLNHDHHHHQNRNHNKIYNSIKLGLFGTLTTILLTGCQPDPDLSKVATEVKATEVDALGFTPASEHTIAANQALRSRLPFDDVQDFEDAKRGFIASMPELKVVDDTGKVIWDRTAYDFIEGEAPASVNPSLWRQASLNNIDGLFEVTQGVYQLRGFDLANMTAIVGDSGWIIVDPLTTAETAKTALNFLNQTLGERPVSAIVFTHSHMDHFGGALGLFEQAPDEGIDIIAPAGFMHEATSENVMAGTAMSRRAMYMYGKQLPRNSRGHIDSGLGKEPAFGEFGILSPNVVVEHDSAMEIDGVPFEFQIVSGSEAPAEFTFYLPEQQAYCGAELVSKNMHNLYTLRGAKVRDALVWSRAIDDALNAQRDTKVYFGSHHWPIWGQAEVNEFLQKQRDTYKYIHDQSVRMLNAGLTPAEIAEQIQMPPSLSNTFASRGYYGTVKHNAKAVYQAYLGWYDANPVNLDPLPATASAVKYVELMGGADKIITAANKAVATGEYRWAAELVNHLVVAEPEHKQAKALLASIYDQLGYQAESAPWRDVYLSAAYELRHGSPEVGIDLASMKQILLQSPVENFMQSMASRVIGPEVFGEEFILNINFTDLDKNYVLELKNSVLHHKLAPKSANANATLNISHELFVDLIIGKAGVKEVLFSDELEIEGSKLDLVSFFSSLDKPKGVFNIVTP
ncbi:alkyl/aryl-sulfatase [Shewanella fidelis]|uniref:Linear primary-alkylsulfatase n=1 Tax=Shewanella fidelis TaxID=173509 RepID=A0AAW8NNX0_9GAMM|nr:alkyl sulfatase dimerization domain-containing protein [Shewanella fidelis]MDR8524587.1 MBL fold metallo-hydrolase [Shewanella fidelis]MDW4812062.1 MBL fold metallo-hydrolase [Shewanella fidelis]MDW4817483.1 MBL fold metallo-hydrolase [Shewanella fidelis]MDW4821550.1 MBL fold metallo-hydrolase [Shewanella fidelis]MDW4822669.1 MBL fold metallo-hydrolase [Shewanella fidelis]